MEETCPRPRPENDDPWSWLRALMSLKGSFFRPCLAHVDATTPGLKKVCFFCRACERALCKLCVHEHPEDCGPNTLQLVIASHSPAFKVEEINKVIDVSDLEVFKINSNSIYFLDGRPRLDKHKQRKCPCCNRALNYDGTYCSIICKHRCGGDLDPKPVSRMGQRPQQMPRRVAEGERNSRSGPVVAVNGVIGGRLTGEEKTGKMEAGGCSSSSSCRARPRKRSVCRAGVEECKLDPYLREQREREFWTFPPNGRSPMI